VYQVIPNSPLDETFELIDESSNSTVVIAPDRGGMVIGFKRQGRELLYLNKESYDNKQANVRGGIPILFPICGQLPNGQYEWGGRIYQMKNHGVARNHPWQVVEYSADGEASIILRLVSNDETLRAFPFEFELSFKYVLKDGILSILQDYINHSDKPMPFFAGFHPYFQEHGKIIRVTAAAQTLLDYNDMQEKPFSGQLDLTDKTEALALLDNSQSDLSFTSEEENDPITLEFGSEFRYVVFWTESAKDFVCVEPWMARNSELIRKQELYFIEPGQSMHTFLKIR
jgi:galactose mutarotase-like enzyme